jgi:HlyD family secretion protein
MMLRSSSIVLGVLFSVVGCGSPTAPSAQAPADVIPISKVQPEKRPIVRVFEQPGTVEAFEETVLFAKLPGYVKTLSIDPGKADRPDHDRAIDIGSRVKKDQVLAELSIPELDEEVLQKEAFVRQVDAEVTQARKALIASEATMTSTRAMVVEAKAGLSRSEANFERWQSEITRVTKLVTDGVIDSQSRDEIQNQFKSAEAGRNEALAKVTSAEAVVTKSEADADKARADVAAVEASLEVARADARRVQALQQYTKIRAPFDGVITRRGVNTGDLVKADGTHGLFTIVRLDPMRVIVHVPEADAGLVEVGQPIALSLQAMNRPTISAQVTRTSWSLIPGARTLRVEVDVPNPDQMIRPGMYVTAKINAELPADWSVPVAAVGKVNDERVIYMVEGGKAVRVAVKLGAGDRQNLQLRQVKKPGSTDWTDITGSETIVMPASAISDGQAIP